MTLVWVALAVSVVLSTVGVVIAGRAGLALYRELRRSGVTLADRMEDLARRAELASSRMATVEASTGRVAPSIERLAVSLARLAVLREAVADVQATANRVTALYPRK